jgi:methionine aminopeptidase
MQLRRSAIREFCKELVREVNNGFETTRVYTGHHCEDGGK